MKYCIYHKKCTDGFGAAFAVWSKHKNEFRYIPWLHYEKLPKFNKDDVLYFCDISPKKSRYLKLKNEVADIFIIEHHATAYNELNGLLNKDHFIYSNEDCGSILTWKFFIGNDYPKFMEYIKYRDLELPYPSIDVLNAIYYVYSFPFDFKLWDRELLSFFNESEVIKQGEHIVRYCKSACDFALESTLTVNIGGHLVPAINTKDNITMLGHLLCEKHKNLDFTAFYSLNSSGNIVVSLRSCNVNVEAIAKMYGGGGHAFASAFVISRERFNPCWHKKLLYKLAGTYYITIEKYNKFRTNIF